MDSLSSCILAISVAAFSAMIIKALGAGRMSPRRLLLWLLVLVELLRLSLGLVLGFCLIMLGLDLLFYAFLLLIVLFAFGIMGGFYNITKRI